MTPDHPPASAAELLSHPRFVEAMSLAGTPLIRDITDKYRPWPKVRAIARDKGLDPLLAWIATKWQRRAMWRPLPLRSEAGQPFMLAQTGSISEQLHRLDRETGGGGSVALDREHGVFSDEETQRRFLIRSMMDEAIDSAIMEGARTSIRAARELLRSGRPPRDKHEQMVANNYEAMRRIKGWIERPLSIEMLVEIQSILTTGALDDDAPRDGSGRLRRPGEVVDVVDKRSHDVVYTPPMAEQMPQRLQSVCDFANASHVAGTFLHPIIKACVLHFMIGYEHPFVDGNGRTARAVFYWCALRHGYRIVEFLSISELIRAASASYPHAYMNVESDDNDITYFVLYKLDIIRRALERLAGYLAEEEKRILDSRRLLRLDSKLNLRQRLLLEFAIKNPTAEFSAQSQATVYGVTQMTARADLEHLRRRRFLRSFKVGKKVVYVLEPDIVRRLASSIRKHG